VRTFDHNKSAFSEGNTAKCTDKSKQIKITQSINLDNFAVLPRSGKMARSAAVKEDMKHDPIKGGILRMSVTFPIRNMHIPFHIPLAGSIAIDPNGGMNKVRSGFPVPESELNDFNQSSIGRSKSRPERSRIPERLPFELGPFFGDVAEGFVHLRNTQIGCFAVDTETGGNRTLHLKGWMHTRIKIDIITYFYHVWEELFCATAHPQAL
jgi:hypothetical protein